MKRKLNIAIVVHGRFHVFYLASALYKRGHIVTLFTNYPKWAVNKFGVDAQIVKSLWIHGVLSRLFLLLHKCTALPYPESFMHQWFSRWAARQLQQRSNWDIVHSFSGISEEIFRTLKIPKTLVRASAHIQAQYEILSEAERRMGVRIDKPSPWIIEREKREYALADKIMVLSRFAQKSFLDQGVPSDKIRVIPIDVAFDGFGFTQKSIEERCYRIRNNAKLRVLYVGHLSVRKGIYDLMDVIKNCNDGFEFRCVGEVLKEAENLIKKERRVEIVGKVPQSQLLEHYQWADLFIFPTIEDGFAAVLMQARGNGLPILTTTNCYGPELIEDDKTGWVVPIWRADLLCERLNWCHHNREALVEMVRVLVAKSQKLRQWDDVAADVELMMEKCIEAVQK